MARSVVPVLAVLALTHGSAASPYVSLLSPSQVSGLPPLPAGGAQTFTFKIDAASIIGKYKTPAVKAQLRVYVDSKNATVPSLSNPYPDLITYKNLAISATSATVTLDELRAGLKGATPYALKWEVCAGPDPDFHILGSHACDCSETWYSYQAPPTPTPVPPADLAVSVEPDFTTVWPTAFRVRNLGARPSDATTLDVSVEVLQGDLDVVKQHCHPRFTDFTAQVPEMLPNGSAVLKPPPPEPMKIRYRPGLSKNLLSTPAPGPTATPNPVKQVVACRYEIRAHVPRSRTRPDPNPSNDVVVRTINVDVPLP